MYREASLNVIVAFMGKVFALDRMTGAIKWRVELPQSIGPVELLVDDDLVVACGNQSLAFIGYADGAVRKLVTRTDIARSSRPVFVADGPHLLIAANGEAACYSRDGDLVWEQGFKGEGYGEADVRGR
jgi:outer membrane protein assembly factor BamB